jgi:Fic family protein
VDIDSLKQSPIGQLVPISGTDGRSGHHYQYFAYLADPLPSSVDLSPETWIAVAGAEVALARLDEAARQVPQPALLRRPALRREAQSTSALEGTFAPLEDVLESEPEERGRLSVEMREILNYVVAAEEAFSWIRERPLTTGLIEGLQYILVQGTRGEYSDAGRIRDRQVFIGPKDAPIQQARFVPAPFGDQLRAGLEEWIRWVGNPPPTMPPVVQAGMAHYQFETLHPFSDGNGRIGRLLIVLQLMRLGVLRHPILVVSPWFEARRSEYQGALLTLSETGDWDTWIKFFATGVGAAAATTHERVDELLSWQHETLARVRAAGVSGVAERVAGELIGAPVLRASQVAKRHNVTHQAGMNALRRLAELGIVDERPRNGRVSFTATRVVALLSL